MAGGGHNEPKFKAAILALSSSKNWDEAKAEWELDFVYVDPSDRKCECEHSPIHQICVIRNLKNSNKSEVGNVCVRRFLRLLSNRIFSSLRKIQLDINKSLNPKSLQMFRERGVITYAEENSYAGYWLKRTSLTNAQKIEKLDINHRVLAYFNAETAKLIAKAQAVGIEKIRPQRLP